MSNPFVAKWSRNGNLLCHGHWLISYKEKEFTLPEKYKENHMGTMGVTLSSILMMKCTGTG